MTLFVFFGLMYAADDAWNEILRGNTLSEEMHKEAFLLSQRLISSPGEPSEWNSTNVSTVGLAYQRHVLDSKKLAEFIAISLADYEGAKEALGTGYDFYFAVQDSDGNVLFETEKKLTNYSRVSSVTRYCFLDGSKVTMVFALGEE